MSAESAGKKKNDSLSAAFMQYFHQFMKQKEEHGRAPNPFELQDSTAGRNSEHSESSILDHAWLEGEESVLMESCAGLLSVQKHTCSCAAMKIMDAIR